MYTHPAAAPISEAAIDDRLAFIQRGCASMLAEAHPDKAAVLLTLPLLTRQQVTRICGLYGFTLDEILSFPIHQPGDGPGITERDGRVAELFARLTIERLHPGQTATLDRAPLPPLGRRQRTGATAKSGDA